MTAQAPNVEKHRPATRIRYDIVFGSVSVLAFRPKRLPVYDVPNAVRSRRFSFVRSSKGVLRKVIVCVHAYIFMPLDIVVRNIFIYFFVDKNQTYFKTANSNLENMFFFLRIIVIIIF